MAEVWRIGPDYGRLEAVDASDVPSMTLADPIEIDTAEAMGEVCSALGLTGNGGKYRSVFRSHEMWRLLAARSGVLSPGLVKRAKAWGEQI